VCHRGIAIPFSRLAARYEADERAGEEWPQLVALEDAMVAIRQTAELDTPPERLIPRCWSGGVMNPLPDEARNLVNHDVLQFLERQAKPAKPEYAVYDIDE
jgi:hypothetical protein